MKNTLRFIKNGIQFQYLLLTLTYIATFLLVIMFEPNFSGALLDSKFYINEFLKSNWSTFYEQSDYSVASSPIFMWLFGSIVKLFGNFKIPFVHMSYFLFSALSIFFITKLVSNLKLRFIILFSLFTNAYFIAPTISPTSDIPSFCFALMSLFFFKTKNKAWLSFSLFCLISTRQVYVWLIIYFIVIEMMQTKRKFQTILGNLLVYIPSFLSLLFTYIFFGNSFTPKSYVLVNTKFEFQIPNFSSLLQLEISIFFQILAFTILINWQRDEIGIPKYLVGLLLLVILNTLIIFTVNFDKLDQQGLGWLSLFSIYFFFPTLFIVGFSSLGSFLFVYMVRYLNRPLYPALFLLAIFSIISLLMPIPFLRYFALPVWLILFICLFENGLSNFEVNTRNFGLENYLRYKYVYLALIYLAAVNWSAIVL